MAPFMNMPMVLLKTVGSSIPCWTFQHYSWARDIRVEVLPIWNLQSDIFALLGNLEVSNTSIIEERDAVLESRIKCGDARGQLDVRHLNHGSFAPLLVLKPRERLFSGHDGFGEQRVKLVFFDRVEHEPDRVEVLLKLGPAHGLEVHVLEHDILKNQRPKGNAGRRRQLQVLKLSKATTDYWLAISLKRKFRFVVRKRQ